MSSSWTLKSIPPHDFFICLDVEQYFDLEHDPEQIFDKGFTRPVPLGDRDIVCSIFFNGDPDNPEFHITSAETLTKKEISEANISLSRILGTDLDIRPLYDRAKNDAVLGRHLTALYGLKRLSRANFFEDAMNRIIIAQIRHRPTAKKMVYGVREAYGIRLEYEGGNISAWPRPFRLVSADPASLKKHGLSLRKGEYVIGIADELVSGRTSNQQMESLAPPDFYERARVMRGIGPTTAQDLMMFRNRTDAVFPSDIDKGQEKGLRRWIILSYGGDPNHTTDKQFQHMISDWKGYESCALEFLFVNWVLSEKQKRQT
ncbi:MAG: DNA-3-methyladenine glycosylase family protein [Cyclonatronaceae bacterium]